MERKTLPNQKIIKSHKKDKYKGSFMYMGCEELSKAMHELNGSEIKVWLYLMKNQPNTDWILYMVNCTGFTGISSKSYYDSINSLINKGYLVLEKGNTYGAYDLPINSTSIESEILVESSSIYDETPEKSSRQLSSKKLDEIPEETTRENNTKNNKKEQYNRDANAGDASLVLSASANGFIVNEDTDAWLKECLSIPEIQQLPEEEQSYNNGYYKETAKEIEYAVIKGLKNTSKDKKGLTNSEVFIDPLDYGLVLYHLMHDSSILRKKRAYGERNVLSFHIGIVLNWLKDGDLKAEREKLKSENYYFKKVS